MFLTSLMKPCIAVGYSKTASFFFSTSLFSSIVIIISSAANWGSSTGELREILVQKTITVISFVFPASSFQLCL